MLRSSTYSRLLLVSLFTRGALGSSLRRRLHRELIELGDGDPIPVPYFQDEDGDGFPDGIFQDEDGDGKPDWMDNTNMPDWGNMDWGNFDLENFDWANMDWNPDQWNGFLENLVGGGDVEGGTPPIDFCPILETVVGMGQAFGVAGGCTCDGSLEEGLNIDCSFEECVQGSNVCGTVGMNVAFNGNGFVNTTICMDTGTDQYEEICFSYQLDMLETGAVSSGSNVFDVQATCSASYGGNPCTCDIEDFCLTLDCSKYLPGAKLDTCQNLAFDQAEDAVSLMPRFPIFDESFNGMFDFESIDWENLDWQNLDWNNFNFTQIDWTNVDFGNLQWGSLFGDDMTPIEICPILSDNVLGMNEAMMENGCSCEGDLQSGFNVLCSFEKQCTTPAKTEISTSPKETSESTPTICGDVALDLGFDTVGSIAGNLCVDFDEDMHLVTCIDYAIPIADQTSEPKCQATYGGVVCNECNIDENLCVRIDCSNEEPTAVMDTCQVLSLENQGSLEGMVPRFGIPPINDENSVVDDPNAGDTEDSPDQDSTNNEQTTESSPDDESTVSESNRLENSAASSSLASMSFLGAAFALVAIAW